jgi:cell division protein FtsB
MGRFANNPFYSPENLRGDSNSPRNPSGDDSPFRRRRLLVAFGVVLLLGYIFIGGKDGFYQIWRVNVEIDALREEVARLEQEKARLEKVNELLKSDSAAIERLARERYGMARPGEVVYRLVLPDSLKGKKGP